MIASYITSMAVALGLVIARMSAFVVVSPFPGNYAPTQIKIGLVLLLAFVATPFGVKTPEVGPALVAAGMAEVATGASIGLIFKLGTMCGDLVGAGIGQSMGLSLGASYDPNMGTQADPLARIISNAGMLVAFAIGAHRVVIGAVVGSMRAVPLGSVPDLDTLGGAVFSWLGTTVDTAVALALPAVTISICVQLALALAARAAPALQAFGVGLALTLGSGIAVVMAGSGDILAGLANHLGKLTLVMEKAFGGA